MLAAQSIYGLHGERTWSDGSVALGRRLTRLLPEDVYDAQPIRSTASPFVLVADLRLDDREGLAAALGISAAAAVTICDAALLLAAFERWDDDCVDHLIGDYAFALWDARAHRLVLARDIIGERPLHYHRSDAFFFFASMPKGLHALAEVPRAPDEERIAEFLALMPEYGPQSFFKGIERVEPGQVVTVTPSGVRVRRYWNWPRRILRLRNANDYAEGLRHHLDLAVRSRLRGAESRVAAHLSAGFDSSAVATTAARLVAPSGGRVVAFTAVPRAGYDLPIQKWRLADEGPLAAMTARMHPNIEHVLVETGMRTPLDTLDRDFFLYDRPLLNPCANVWSCAINDAIRARQLRVLLIGDTGNVTLSYAGGELLSELVQSGRLIEWGRVASAILRRGDRRLRGVLLATLSPWLPRSLWQFLSRTFLDKGFDIREYSSIHPARFGELDLASRADTHGLDFTYRPWKNGLAVRLWVLNRVDPGNYRKGVLAGWGIDARDPTADRRLLEFCLSVPTEHFFRDGIPRALARAVLAGSVPPEVLNEKRAGLSVADWHEGMTGARPQIAEEIGRLEKTAPARRALDLARMRALAENWPSEGWHRPEIIQRYRLALLRGIAVGHFLRRASGGNA